MKKIISIVAALAGAAALFAANPKNTKANVITVGATPKPHAEMLNLVK